MSFISIAQAAQNAKPEECVPEGEYKLRIISAAVHEDRGFIMVRFELVDDPYAKEVTQLFNLPGSGRNPKEENRNVNRLISFFKCFGMDISKDYNPEEPEPSGFVNREGWALLTGPIDDGKGYGEQNRVKFDGFLPRR